MLNKKKDREWQIKCIELANGLSLLGGRAEVCHHFIHRRVQSVRYDIDNGICLTNEQHQRLHTQNRKEMEERIIKIKGRGWYKKLIEKSLKKASLNK